MCASAAKKYYREVANQRHGMRQPGMLGGLGLDDFYRHQAPLVRQQRP